jgi:potassium/chloride transporter 4/5/6
VVTNTFVNGTAAGNATTISTPNLHDLQVYGIIVTILLCFIVFGGVKIINKVAPAFLIPVLFSILCIYIGVFIAPRPNASSKYPLANNSFIVFSFVFLVLYF